MKGTDIYVSLRSDGTWYINGRVEVPGLGQIEMRDCLSIDTCERLMREIEAAASVRLTGSLPPVEQ